VCGKANYKRDEGTVAETKKTVARTQTYTYTHTHTHIHTEGEAHKMCSSGKGKREGDS